MNVWQEVLLVAAGGGLFGGTVGWVAKVVSDRVSFKHEIEPIVTGEGMYLKSSSRPKKGETGPFPAEAGPYRFRIVRMLDDDGNESLSWARLRLEDKKVIEIDWRPDFRAQRT